MSLADENNKYTTFVLQQTQTKFLSENWVQFQIQNTVANKGALYKDSLEEEIFISMGLSW